MCDYKVSQKNQLDKHILENHKSSHQCLVCELYFRNIGDLSNHMDITHDKNEEILVKCNHCGKGCKDKEEIKTHIFYDHQTYKPCKKYGIGTCEARRCRFNHIKLQGKNEICFKCGEQFESKTDLINNIKSIHGNTICHKFLENKCDRNSEECIFSHSITTQGVPSRVIQQDFHRTPPPPLHSPGRGMPNMSTHIQNQQQKKDTQAIPPRVMNIVDMIPQIVSQIIQALTVQISNSQ